MKRKSLFIIFLMALFAFAEAQIPPQLFNYSAVARNSSGQPLSASTIGVQISILKSTASGPVVYSENHSATTDPFGLFRLVIGSGSAQSGSISSIDWANDSYFLKVGLDINGGTNFVTMGTTQFVSVPYALFSGNAGVIDGPANFTHYIGEEFGGGVIFYLWKDTAGIEHGLIVDKVDLSVNGDWSNIDALIGPSAQSTWDGLSNSLAIVAQAGHTNSAALLCLNSTNGGQSDWYLPAIDELSHLFHNRFNVNKTLTQLSGASLLSKTMFYYSSTEYWGDPNFPKVYLFRSDQGTNTRDDKTFNLGLNYHVRAIRSF